MNRVNILSPKTIPRDLMSGLIVFLVALPLCLGIALASGAPLFSGIVAGIIGGIVVAIISGSHTSVSGPAAGLTAIVAAQIATLGSFETFLLAVVIGGIAQVILGIARAGALSAFFPSSVIKGLLAAIGIILIIKQIPYLLGYDSVPTGNTHEHPNILSQITKLFTGEVHYGAFAIGAMSMALLIIWDKWKVLKNSLIPAPLVAVVFGVIVSLIFRAVGGQWALIDKERLMVSVPVAESLTSFIGFLTLPDFSKIANPAVYIAGITIAIVASLETLLNLDAIDKLDKQQRLSPPSRELLAQGVGNIACGMMGGLPVTSVIIRGSVNINSGSQTKLSAITHGFLLLICVMLVPTYLNMIPLACLAAILLVTGFKLASPKLFRQMWSEGFYQFLPFIITLVAIVATDLLIGILIGMGVSLLFILKSNLTIPIHQIVEKHVGGEVLHIELANQVSFLNKAALEKALRSAPRGTHLLLDARRTDYIDPDILSFIREFKEVTAPVYDVQVSLRGFRDKHQLEDEIQFVDFTTRELQSQLNPHRVLHILKEGNQRFCSGHRLDRDLCGTLSGESSAEHPMAVVFSGIDPRTPAELIFDLGLGDIFSVRVAGNVVGPKILGSLEYGCIVGGAKLIVVLGHTNSGLMKCAVEFACSKQNAEQLTGCPHLESILHEIQQSIEMSQCQHLENGSPENQLEFIDATARRNVIHTVQQVVQQSPAIRRLIDTKQIAIIGAILDIKTGKVDFLAEEAIGF
jgi:carbonic anhydrase/SulP family sulfate permease